MIDTILILSSLIFAAIYPLVFWISVRDPLKNNFHKFHLGLSNFVGGIIVVVLLFRDIPLEIKIFLLCWKATLLSFSKFYWKKAYPDPRLLTIPCLLGISSFILVQNQFIRTSLAINVVSVLSGFIFCAAIFAMNLGHWYLNVHGLPIDHLKRTVYCLGIFLGIKIVWDVYVLLTGTIFYQGEILSLFAFTQTMEGFFLWVAIFFGNLFPLIALHFVKGTLEVK